jgi:Transglycosylase SLT domain/SPOR domain
MIQSAAADNGLPVDFFARLIWQESRLKPNVIGPLTRSGGRAQGIAQFMPSTAQERLLRNPFDPAQALPKSAEFLRELRAKFGNLGLAAAAYNAGPQRVQDWLAKKRPLPPETQAYVRIVTGRPAEEWRSPQANVWNIAIQGDAPCVETAERPAKSAIAPAVAQQKSIATWAVQLVGDRSEMSALASYNRLRKKHEAILGVQKPVVVRTTLGMSSIAIWHRIRIEANSREAAETLCSRLRAAGGSCLVGRI